MISLSPRARRAARILTALSTPPSIVRVVQTFDIAASWHHDVRRIRDHRLRGVVERGFSEAARVAASSVIC